MKEQINEHDMTKKMMDIMRGGFKPLLNENQEEPKDTIAPQYGDAVFKDELKKLSDIVDSSVEITNFKIYPVDKNVVIDGVFLQRESEGSGITFKMSLRAGEVETTMEGVDLNDNVSDILHKLKGYYEVWSKEWWSKLATEYRPKEY